MLTNYSTETKSNFIGWLTLMSAISISGVSAYFSVDGIIALFSATPWKAGIMAVVLEIGKIVAALWLHHNFGVKKHFFLKAYLVLAVVILMVITSMGIFGTLSKSFMDHTGQSVGTYNELALIDTQIEDLESTRSHLNDQLKSLDRYVDVYLNDKNSANARAGVRLANRQKSERATLQAEIRSINAEISSLKTKKSELSTDVAGIESEVGPIIYVAEMIYGERSQEVVSKAIRFVILVIVICFDPLAILLLIAAQISFSQRTKIEVPEWKAPDIIMDSQPVNIQADELKNQVSVSDVKVQAEQVKSSHSERLKKFRKKIDTKIEQIGDRFK